MPKNKISVKSHYLTDSGNYPGVANGVFVSNKVAYVVGKNPGMQILDVSNPGSPKLMGKENELSEYHNVHVSSSESAFISKLRMGVVDARNLSIPRLASEFLYGYAPSISDVYAQENVGYYAANHHGLQIVECETLDKDNDGLLDEWEMAWFLDLDQDRSTDFDGDSILDWGEFQAGTDPTENADKDADGLLDVYEIKIHMTDVHDLDTDSDGVNDGEEIEENKNPLSPYDNAVLSDISIDSNSWCRIEWHAANAVVYQVQTAPFFDGPNGWVNAPGGPMPDMKSLQGSTISGFLHYIDTRTNAPQCYYRVLIRDDFMVTNHPSWRKGVND